MAFLTDITSAETSTKGWAACSFITDGDNFSIVTDFNTSTGTLTESETAGVSGQILINHYVLDVAAGIIRQGFISVLQSITVSVKNASTGAVYASKNWSVKDYCNEAHFMWINSQGGFDTYMSTGRGARQDNVNRVSILNGDPSTLTANERVVSVYARSVFKARTQMLNKSARIQMAGLYKSPQVYVDGSEAILANDTVGIFDDISKKDVVEIDYRLALTDGGVNG
jgi:hypothetical protein